MSKQQNSVWQRAVLAVLVAGFWSTSGTAQDEENVLEEVMVTGSRANDVLKSVRSMFLQGGSGIGADQ